MVEGEVDKDGNVINEPTHTREEAAKVLGLSKSYVANLCRCAQKLAPEVQGMWKKDPQNIPIGTLNAWAVLDHDSQVKAMNDFMGGGDGEKKGKKEKKKSKGDKARAAMGVLAKSKREVMEALAWMKEHSDEASKEWPAYKHALEWVLGQRKKLIG